MTIYDTGGSALTGFSDIVVDDSNERSVSIMDSGLLSISFTKNEIREIPIGSYIIFEGRKYTLFNNCKITKNGTQRYRYEASFYDSSYYLSLSMFRFYTGQQSVIDNRITFPYTATPREHLELLCRCINADLSVSSWKVDYSATIGMVQDDNGEYIHVDGTKYNDEGDMKLVTYDSMTCVEAIRNMADVFGTEYEVDEYTSGNDTYYLVSLRDVKYNESTPLVIRYGEGNGLKPGIVRDNKSEQPLPTRLYIKGGEQNIPEHYGQEAVTEGGVTVFTGESRTLLFPKGATCFYDGRDFYFYVNGALYDNDGTVFDYELPAGRYRCYKVSSDRRSIQRVNHSVYDPEYTTPAISVGGIYDGTEIYPMRVGTIYHVDEIQNTGIEENNDIKFLYDIYDRYCPDYSQLSVPDEKMTVIMQDGMLAGREFDLNTTQDGTVICEQVTLSGGIVARRMELCPSEQDNMIMPNENFKPKAGDHYAVFHCSLPQEYVSGIAYGAEFRALREAVKQLYDGSIDRYTVECDVDEKYIRENWNTIHHGSVRYGDYFSVGQYITVKDEGLFGNGGVKLRVTEVRQKINNRYDIKLTLSNLAIKKIDWNKQLRKAVEEVNGTPPVLRPNQHVRPQFRPSLRNHTYYRNSDSVIVVPRDMEEQLENVEDFVNDTSGVIDGVLNSLDNAQMLIEQTGVAVNHTAEILAYYGMGDVIIDEHTQETQGILKAGKIRADGSRDFDIEVPQLPQI